MQKLNNFLRSKMIQFCLLTTVNPNLLQKYNCIGSTLCSWKSCPQVRKMQKLCLWHIFWSRWGKTFFGRAAWYCSNDCIIIAPLYISIVSIRGILTDLSPRSSDGLFGKCMVAKQLSGSRCPFGWWVGSVEWWMYWWGGYHRREGQFWGEFDHPIVTNGDFGTWLSGSAWTD